MRLAASIVGSRWLVARGAAWVERRRRDHRPFAEPLAPDLMRAFGPYFESETLEATRVHRVPRIDPPWPAALAGRLRPLALDFGHVWGITYIDTLVLAADILDESQWEECLFHECVHVAQYRLHGLTGFVAKYVRGWAEAGWSYQGIGLEREAYALQGRFADGDRFRVEDELVGSGVPP
jgi:hypothetical protein